MEFKLKEYAIFDAGQRKDSLGNPHQEDSIYPPYGADADTSTLFMVCDGMGGHDAGEVASATVCEAISHYIKSHDYGNGTFTNTRLHEALTAGYEALDAKDTGADKKMGTTLALLKLHRNGYTVAHIGDSRVYHFRPGATAESTKIIFRTEDHSLVNFMVRTGQMTPGEAAESPKRHVITRAMQPNMERRSKADVYSSDDVRPGDYFMLCTDGIYENLDDSYLLYLFSADGGSDKNKVNQLTKATSNNSDNHSAIIVHITDVITPVAAEEADKKDNKKTRTVKNNKQTGVQHKAKEFVDKHKGNGSVLELLIKFLFILMAVIAVIMLIYYLFIRTDEDLQRAGTAVDAPIEQAESVSGEEKYGYEITEQDIRNEAQEIAPEYTEVQEDEIIDETPAEGEQPQETSADEPAHNDEPILQE